MSLSNDTNPVAIPTKENALLEQGSFETSYESNTNQVQVPSQSDFQVLFCSGYGQYHTNEESAKERQPYAQISLDQIRKLVDNPQQVNKVHAQWLIPSTLMSRTFKTQEEQGEYWMLWADIDHNSKGINELPVILESLITSVDYEIYTSKSATETNQKCRVLIPLSKPLLGSDWVLVQEILNDKLEACGIQPDQANEGAAQLCYLPNRGNFYDSKSKRDGRSFDPLNEWTDDIRSKHEEITRQTEELEKRRTEVKSKREAFNTYFDKSISKSN